jgi:hypothetical protein
MKRSIATCLACIFIVTFTTLGLPTHGAAANITMSLTDFDVVYLGSAQVGGALYDGGGPFDAANGSFDTSDADQLQAASFKSDQTAVGTLVDAPASSADDMWANLHINGVGSSIPLDVINFGLGNNDGTYGFDWFLRPKNNAGGVGFFLRLGLTNVTVTLTDFPNNAFGFTFSGAGTVLSQNLPFGLAFDTTQRVAFSYTSARAGFSGIVPPIAAGGSGAITITTTKVPEPASFAYVIFAFVGLWTSYRRR